MTDAWPIPDETPPTPDQPEVTIGDIGVSRTSVFIPSGRFPVRGSVWTVTDMSRVEERMSTLGIVLAVLFFWVCFLGLLFLLMKDRTTVGFVQVTVQGDGYFHSTAVPAAHPQVYGLVTQQVNWARSVATA